MTRIDIDSIEIRLQDIDPDDAEILIRILRRTLIRRLSEITFSTVNRDTRTAAIAPISVTMNRDSDVRTLSETLSIKVADSISRITNQSKERSV